MPIVRKGEKIQLGIYAFFTAQCISVSQYNTDVSNSIYQTRQDQPETGDDVSSETPRAPASETT